MVMNRAAILLLAACLLDGCAHNWPLEGHGGLAERDKPCDPAIGQALQAIEYLKSTPGLRPPSKVAAAEERLIRASRESQAGLYADASHSYDEAVQMLGTDPQNVRRPRQICTLNNNQEGR